jgi:hypothetical protein
MAKKQVEGYVDQQYDQTTDVYAMLVQCIQNVKYGDVLISHKWNIPVDRIEGITYRQIGVDGLELTSHHYEIGTIEQLTMAREGGQDFIRAFVKELKKEFKKLTHKTLELKVVKPDCSVEKVGGMRAHIAWSPDSNIGKYLVRDSCVYEFDPELLG